jgi:DNA polymerase elongation subunit (family B)
MKNEKLKILFLDIENFPCLVYSWGLNDQFIPLDFLVRDWTICAWAAKWADSDEVFYMDNRSKRDIYEDKALVKGLIKLINEADIIIGQNVRSFDMRKIAARAEFHGLPPFKPAKITDILTEERHVFALTSHKLAYKTERNKKYKKLKHEKYPGFDLWKACMAKKADGWREMEVYCKHDVLSTEERYNTVKGWIRIQHQGPADGIDRCKCGSANLEKRGYAYTEAGKYQIYLCHGCGRWPRSAHNVLTKEQRAGQLRQTIP